MDGKKRLVSLRMIHNLTEDTSKRLTCIEILGPEVEFVLVAWFGVTIVTTASLLLYTYWKAKQKVEADENKNWGSETGSYADYSEEEESETDLGGMYQTLPEEYKKVIKHKSANFSLAQINEEKDAEEEEEEKNSGSEIYRENSSDETLQLEEDINCVLNTMNTVRSSSSEQEPTSTKSSRSSRRDSTESKDKFPSSRPFPLLAPVKPLKPSLKARSSLERSESQTKADYYLRLMSRPQEFDASMTSRPVEEDKRSPTGRKISRDHSMPHMETGGGFPRARKVSRLEEGEHRLYVNLPSRSHSHSDRGSEEEGVHSLSSSHSHHILV